MGDFKDDQGPPPAYSSLNAASNTGTVQARNNEMQRMMEQYLSQNPAVLQRALTQNLDAVINMNREVDLRQCERKAAWKKLTEEGLNRDLDGILDNNGRLLDEHTISKEDLLSRLNTDEHAGLTDEGVKVTLKNSGRNVPYQPVRKRGVWECCSVCAGFGCCLLSAGLVALAITMVSCFVNLKSHHAISIVIGISLATVILATVVGGFCCYYRLLSAWDRYYATFNFDPVDATVLRNGKMQRMSAEDLVPGDIVQVKTGEQIPADIRLISGDELIVQNTWMHTTKTRYNISRQYPLEPLPCQQYAFHRVVGPEWKRDGNCCVDWV